MIIRNLILAHVLFFHETHQSANGSACKYDPDRRSWKYSHFLCVHSSKRQLSRVRLQHRASSTSMSSEHHLLAKHPECRKNFAQPFHTLVSTWFLIVKDAMLVSCRQTTAPFHTSLLRVIQGTWLRFIAVHTYWSCAGTSQGSSLRPYLDEISSVKYFKHEANLQARDIFQPFFSG